MQQQVPQEGSPEKGCLVEEITENQKVDGVFLVKDMNMAETRAGKPFLTLTLMDKSGEVTGRVWDNAETLKGECPAGNLVRVSGLAQSYKGTMQLKVNSLKAIDSNNADLTMFVPVAPGDHQAMLAELKSLMNSVEDKNLKKLLQAFFRDQDFVDSFCRAPAAKSMHHAYIGGLLEHTLAICRLADAVATLYPAIDRSLLLCGALVHDIGKVKEFTYQTPPFDYSDQGRLVGHMVLAIEMIQEKASKLKDFPEELGARLKHLILSHHGRHEFGSPTLPMIREAFILNFLDDLDAKVNYFDRLSAQVKEPGYQWSDFQRNMSRFLFLSGDQQMAAEPAAEQAPGNATPEPLVDNRQQTLWEL